MQSNASFSYSVNQKDSSKNKKVNHDRVIYAIIFAIMYGLLGFFNLSARQYSVAALYIGGAITIVLIAYFLNRYNIQIRLRIAIGILFIALGVLFFYIVDTADFFFGFAGLFTAGISETSAIVAALVALIFCSVVVLVALSREVSKQGMKFRQLLTRRYLLPYAAAAMIIFSAYVVVITGLQFDSRVGRAGSRGQGARLVADALRVQQMAGVMARDARDFSRVGNRREVAKAREEDRGVEHAVAEFFRSIGNCAGEDEVILVHPGAQPAADLLERRPDIAAAERRMAAANASIGVAKAAFFPAIQLNGLAGFESLHMASLFDWQSRFWSVGPSLTMPLFDAGQNSANLRAARAAYEQAVASYRETVLAAFQDVEDNLAAQTFLARQNDAQTAAVQAARKQFTIADYRYRAGLVTFLDVATAENTALNIEFASVQLRGQQLVAAVSLVRSLGGGWQDLNAQSPSAASR